MRTAGAKEPCSRPNPDLSNSAATRSSSASHVCVTSAPAACLTSAASPGMIGTSTVRSKRDSKSAHAQPDAEQPAAHTGAGVARPRPAVAQDRVVGGKVSLAQDAADRLVAQRRLEQLDDAGRRRLDVQTEGARELGGGRGA